MRYYESGKEIGHYVNFCDEVPRIKLLMKKFSNVPASCVKVFEIFEVDDNQKEMMVYDISTLDYDGDYVKIDTYQRYDPETPLDFAMNIVSPIEKLLTMSLILCGDVIESAQMHCKYASAKSLTYKNGNLHGTQLLKIDNCLVTVNYKHGRYQDMHMYTGGLFNFGTKLEKIETDPEIIVLLKMFDREIRNSCK